MQDTSCHDNGFDTIMAKVDGGVEHSEPVEEKGKNDIESICIWLEIIQYHKHYNRQLYRRPQVIMTKNKNKGEYNVLV